MRRTHLSRIVLAIVLAVALVLPAVAWAATNVDVANAETTTTAADGWLKTEPDKIRKAILKSLKNLFER